ncbi:MAG TPA: prephenate dehydrogenase/arogenate dehydrogenase family protein [Bryobacteraceae bacterium]|jgi:prephenate dehydrogenase
MRTVAIAGTGLIGGSFGLALRKAGFAGQIIGVSSPPAIAAALERGAISSSGTLEEVAPRADLLYLAQPVDRILETLDKLGQLTVAPGCLITDAGSTKSTIVRQAAASLTSGSFLGGHPLAGKEQRGAAAADADLFRDRPYVLTPTGPETSAQAEFRAWLSRLGARIIDLSPEEHDVTVALTSHLPQLVSTALAATLADQADHPLDRVFGPGLVDMTRLALSPPDLWLSILATNRPAVLAALDSFVTSLTTIRQTLGTRKLSESFVSAKDFASRLRNLDT